MEQEGGKEERQQQQQQQTLLKSGEDGEETAHNLKGDGAQTMALTGVNVQDLADQ